MQLKLNQSLLVCRAKKFALGAATFATLFLSCTIFAEGFRNPPPGTFDLGRAGGRIAQVDDSSAVQQNPANLVDITNYQAQLTPSIVYINVSYDSPNGARSASTSEPWKLLPNFFASAPINDRIAVGLGMTVPYGLSMQWDQSSSAFLDPSSWRYQSPYYTSLTTINFNPTVSIKLTDSLSIGVGLDAMWSQVTLKQFYPFETWGGGEGEIKAEGDGVGYGGNLGITWKITDHQRLALTYRSPMDVSYNGDFHAVGIAPAARAAGVTGDSSFNTKIKFPTIVGIGYGIELTDKLRLESDFEYLEFSRFQSLNLNFANNNILFNAGRKPTSIPENWNDTFTAGIGGDYAITENLTVRASYQYYMSPVPDRTFSPTIPDADQNVITVGISYRYKKHSLEAAYGYDFYNTRHINNDQNPAFNGKYTFNVHLISLAYRYSF